MRGGGGGFGRRSSSGFMTGGQTSGFMGGNFNNPDSNDATDPNMESPELQIDAADRSAWKVIGSQTAAQWWKSLVNWRSYRDEWLSDGFTEYAGILYTKYRGGPSTIKDQLNEMRFALTRPPETDTGKGTGKIAEIGSLLLGKRLKTRTTENGYDMLVKKGALVFRMLHFLYTDPANPPSFAPGGNPDQDEVRFAQMIHEFENRYTTEKAGTEEFKEIAEKYYKDSPIAKVMERYTKSQNLNWFFEQWVNEAKLPSYKMKFSVVAGEGGKYIFKGTLFQENAGENWIMPLPVIIKFSDGTETRIVVCARGNEEVPIADVPLPKKPNSVELDPDMWILSEKTSIEKM